MSRLPFLTPDDLDDDQRRVWAAITEGRRGGGRLVNDAGGLVGPFNAMLYSAQVGERLSALGEALRFDSSIDRPLLEVAILTVGAHWRANFEWWAHARLARDAGVAGDVIDAIRDGREPSLAAAEAAADADAGAAADDDAAATVHRFVRSLLTDARVGDATYARTVELLGEAGVVELTALTGYYSLISFLLEGLRVGVPEGVAPTWPDP